MFENLSERLSGVFDRLTKQGALSEEDVKSFASSSNTIKDEGINICLHFRTTS